MRKIEVKPYNKAWLSMFEEEATKLRTIFGYEITEIHHIGSTAVDGLKAKPVIDIMPVVINIGRVEDFNTAMIDIGYEPKRENGLPGRRYFQKGGDERTHHAHFYEVGNFVIKRHLAFRGYLCSHPDTIKEYGNLKKELSHRFPHDIEAYIQGKELLVLEIENRAMSWLQSLSKD